MKHLLERRYGYGAAHVVLRAAPLRRRRTPSLLDGWQAALREEGEALRGGTRRALLRGAAPTFAAIVAALLLGALMRQPVDSSPTEIVPFQEPVPPPVAVEEPQPEPEVVPEPEVAPEPEPEPTPQLIAKALPPPPAVVPEPPKPKPAPPPRAPKPEPPKRTTPPPRIEPVAAPVVARAPTPAPEPPRPTRAPVPTPTRSAPPLAFAAAALPNEHEPDPTPMRRAPAFQSARPSDARVRPALAALDVPIDAPEPSAPAHSTRVASAPTSPRSHSAPPLDFGAPAAPALPGDEPTRDSSARRPVTASATPPRRRERGSGIGLAVPAAPDGDPGPPTQSASAPRAARPTAPAATARREGPELRGVPLASLAACRSDRGEDALKQRVVAAAESRKSCESAAGRFHFVETKNVNAFLMWIERSPGRQLGDRCSELLHALDCLAKAR